MKLLRTLAVFGILATVSYPARHPVKTYKGLAWPLRHPKKTLKAIDKTV